jgi:hypothetical protein
VLVDDPANSVAKKRIMKQSWRAWMTVLVALTIGASTTSCNREAEKPGSGPNSRATTPVDKLPQEFYGVWAFRGSSGGMNGQGNAAYRLEKIVIRDDNVIEEHRPGGTVTRSTFTPCRGKSIFSTEDVWQLQRLKSPMIEVLTLTTNGELTISENVYDGFSYTFKRAEPSSGGR